MRTVLFVCSLVCGYVGRSDGYLVGAGSKGWISPVSTEQHPSTPPPSAATSQSERERRNAAAPTVLQRSAAGQMDIQRSLMNVRFAQMLYTDSKYQALREEMVKANTRNLVYHCRADKSDCEAALAKMRYKASKHFYALSKAVVDYVKNKRQARPSGYVGTATFCQDSGCAPDTEPVVVLGGCYTLISCGGNQTWHLDAVVYKKKKSLRY